MVAFPDSMNDIKQASSLCDLKAIVNRRPGRHHRRAESSVGRRAEVPGRYGSRPGGLEPVAIDLKPLETL